MAADKSPYTAHELPLILEPVKPSAVALIRPTPEPPTPPGSYHNMGVTLEGMDSIVGVTGFDTDSFNAPMAIMNRSPAPTASSVSDRGSGVTLEGMDNIVGVSDATASSSVERPAAIPGPASAHWLFALREMKQRIEQFTDGRFERTSHSVQVRVLTRSLGESYAFLSPIFTD